MTIPAVTTLATMECDDELLLFLTSMREHHADLDIYVACTSEVMGRTDRDTHSNGSRSLAFNAFGKDPNIRWLPLLDRFTKDACGDATSRVRTPILGRSVMERTAGTGFYRTQHDEFMMEKSTIMEYALLQQQLRNKQSPTKPHQCGVLFLDCDITTLAPLPRLRAVHGGGYPRLAVSRHCIALQDELMFGTYNGGMMFVADPSLLQSWRRLTMDPSNRFYDQSSIEGVVDEVLQWSGNEGDRVQSEHCQLFPLQSNFGYWRMLQQAAHGQPLVSTVAHRAGASSALRKEADARRAATYELKYGNKGAHLEDLASSPAPAAKGRQESKSVAQDAFDASEAEEYGPQGWSELFALRTVLARFSIRPTTETDSTPSHNVIFFDDEPLQSVHTHLLVTPKQGGGDNSKMILFNRILIKMMREAVAAPPSQRSRRPHPYSSLLHIIDSTTTSTK